MVAPTLPQPASRGFGPPTFEFDTSETWTSPNFASAFRGLDAVASLGVDLSNADTVASSVEAHNPDEPRVLVTQLVVREKGMPAERAAHELTFEATLRGTAGSGYLLQTSESAEGLDFAAQTFPERDGRVTSSFSFSFTNLSVSSALTLARFARALYRVEGTLSLRDTQDGEELFLGELPLDVTASSAEENDDRLVALEALDELQDFVGEDLTIPPSTDRAALRDVGILVDAVRSGSAILPVTGFDVPASADAVRELLKMFDRQGGLLVRWGTEGESWPIEALGPKIFLGPCRYFAQAQLTNSKSELESWLSGNPAPTDTLRLSWKPIEGSLVLMQYLGWPKPSLRWVEKNISAFEGASGVDSGVFERAYKNGEPWTNEVDRADVWMTLIDSRRALLDSRRDADRRT